MYTYMAAVEIIDVSLTEIVSAVARVLLTSSAGGVDRNRNWRA